MSVKLSSLPVFVISLPDEMKRRARIIAMMDELGLNFDFIDAVDGRQFDVVNHSIYDGAKRLSHFGRHMTGGEIGCILSHQKVYQHIVDHNIPRALVFEDDVILRDDFIPVLKEILALDISYDMIRFFGSPKLERLKMRNVLPLDGKHHLVRHSGMPGGTHATLVTQQGAKRILKHLHKNAYPIDALLGRNWETGLNWYTVRPGLAAQDLSFDSAIGEERFKNDLDITGRARTLFPLTRGWFKLTEALGKKYWYYKQLPVDKKLATNLKDKKHG